MFNIKVISKVEMDPISQEDLEALIIKQIQDQNPQVHVNSINFVQRRDPVRIEAIVDAQLGLPSVKPEPVKEQPPFKEETPINFNEEVVVEEKAPKEPEEVEEKVRSVADIFNMDN